MRALVLVGLLAAAATARADASVPGGAKSKAYFEIYLDPYVRRVRMELDRYLRGELDPESPAVKGVEGDGSDGLNAFSRDYYKSRFIVVGVAPFLVGGRIVSIVFCDKPDAVFDVWIDKLAGGAYELREFFRDGGAPAPDQIAIVYRHLLKDRKHRL